jgi:hypothetical protein
MVHADDSARWFFWKKRIGKRRFPTEDLFLLMSSWMSWSVIGHEICEIRTVDDAFQAIHMLKRELVCSALPFHEAAAHVADAARLLQLSLRHIGGKSSFKQIIWAWCEDLIRDAGVCSSPGISDGYALQLLEARCVLTEEIWKALSNDLKLAEAFITHGQFHRLVMSCILQKWEPAYDWHHQQADTYFRVAQDVLIGRCRTYPKQRVAYFRHLVEKWQYRQLLDIKAWASAETKVHVLEDLVPSESPIALVETYREQAGYFTAVGRYQDANIAYKHASQEYADLRPDVHSASAQLSIMRPGLALAVLTDNLYEARKRAEAFYTVLQQNPIAYNLFQAHDLLENPYYNLPLWSGGSIPLHFTAVQTFAYMQAILWDTQSFAR